MESVSSQGVNPGQNPAPKGRRFASGVIDLILIPLVLGIIIGLILLAVPDAARNIVLILVNIGWLIFRDTVYSPGRAMVGIKLVSLTGPKVTVGQAFVRNILIAIPIVLLIGYIIEIVALVAKGQRVMDGPAKTQVLLAA